MLWSRLNETDAALTGAPGSEQRPAGIRTVTFSREAELVHEHTPSLLIWYVCSPDL